MGCSPIKAARELGSDRRETGRSLSVVGVRRFEGGSLQYERIEWDRPLVCQLFRQEHRWVATSGSDKR